MKRLKSKLALLLALCMLLSSAGSSFAAEADTQSEGATSITDDGILLSIDYEDTIPDLKVIEGVEAKTEIMKGSDGNTCLNVAANWGNNGYPLKQEIPENGGDYEVSFEFCMSAVSKAYYAVMLSDASTETGSKVYHQFGLLSVNADDNFMVAGLTLPDLKWDPTKWYKYSCVFNRASRKITATISEKDDPEKITSIEGTPTRTGNTYGNGIELDRVYDHFKFATGAQLTIDNILVEEWRGRPFNMTASSAHIGNIFSAKDAKQMDISLKNVLLEKATADLEYEVFDEDGNRVDSGKIAGISANARETVVKSIDVNVSKYGVYSLYCTVTAKGETGEPVTFKSDRIAFSVANKREEGEPLNHFTSANIEYANTREEWLKVRELLEQAGVGNVRTEGQWWLMTDANLNWIDHRNAPVWDDETGAGIGSMVILSCTNPYYPGSSWEQMNVHIVDTDEIWEGWRGYINHISTKYKGKIKYYEILNEANVSMGVEHVVKYVKMAAPIIHKNDPDAIVVAGSTGGVQWGWIEDFLRQMGEDAGDYIDLFAMHPYDFDSGEFLTKVSGQPWSVLLRDYYLLEKIQRFKDLQERYGSEEVPISVTELSISSTPGIASTKQQAADLIQMNASAYSQGLLDSIYWYCFENTGIAGAEEVTYGNAENNFGLVANRMDNVPYAAKPSYVALCGYNKMMTNAKPVDNIVDGWTSAYRFDRDNKDSVVLLWTEKGSENISLDLGTSSIEIFDQYTNSIGTMKSANGIYNFTSTFEPIYIVGNITKLKKSTPTISVSQGEIYSVTGDACDITFTDSKKRNLKVEAVGTPYVTIEKNTGIKNGKGTLSLKISDEAWQEEPITVKIYDGDKLVYFAKLHVKVGDEGVSVSYSLGSDLSGEPDRSVINVSVTNKTAGIELAGEVNADFTLAGGKNETRNIVRLKPGETQTVYLNIPQSTAIHRIGATLDLSLGGRFDYNKKLSVIPIMNVLKNETGENGLAALSGDMTKGDQFAANDGLAAASITNWGGPEDAGLQGTLRWDEKNLYIYAEMSDDVFYNAWTGYNVWEGDGLQVGIQDPVGGGPGATAYTELGITKTTEGNQLYRFSVQPGMASPTGLVDNCELDIQVKSGKIIYKAVIPWIELIGKETVSQGDQLLFSICSNENDGSGRRGWVELTEGICTGKSAQKFGTIVLN